MKRNITKEITKFLMLSLLQGVSISTPALAMYGSDSEDSDVGDLSWRSLNKQKRMSDDEMAAKMEQSDSNSSTFSHQHFSSSMNNSDKCDDVLAPPVQWNEAPLRESFFITEKDWSNYYVRWAERCMEGVPQKDVSFDIEPLDGRLKVVLRTFLTIGDQRVERHSITLPYRLISRTEEARLFKPIVHYLGTRSQFFTTEAHLQYHRPDVCLNGLPPLPGKTIPRTEYFNSEWEELVGIGSSNGLREDEDYGKYFHVVGKTQLASPYIYRGSNNEWFLTRYVDFDLAESPICNNVSGSIRCVMKTNYKVNFKEGFVQDQLSLSSSNTSLSGLYQRSASNNNGKEPWDGYNEDLSKKNKVQSTFRKNIKNSIHSIEWGDKCQEDILEVLRLTSFLNTRETPESLFSLGWQYANKDNDKYKDEIRKNNPALASLSKKVADRRAILLFLRSAAQGNINAQNWIGTMAQHGRVPGKLPGESPQNNAEAREWYRMAAEKGHPQAQDNLGVRYQYDTPVPDYENAILWLNKALNNPGSNEKQKKNASDRIKSIERIRQAINKAGAGDPEYQVDLVRMYQSGSDLQKNYERATDWINQLRKNPRANPKQKKQAEDFYRKS